MSDKVVGLLGTGVMGGGIAQVCAQAGYKTISYDVNPEMFARTQKQVEESLQKMVKRGKFTQDFAQEVVSRMQYTADIRDLKDCDIVVEAVYEDLKVKTEVLKQIEEVVSEECLIFTNTSALSVTTLATCLKHKGRFTGTHFFSPVPAMKLVELVKGLDTTPETYEKSMEWCKEIGKVTIDAPDTSGFISNRLLPLPQNEGAELVALGVDPADIDACYQLLNAAPMGTMEMADGGLHVTVGCLTSIYEGNEDERYRPHPYIKQLVAGGRIGKRTGQGFFKW